MTERKSHLDAFAVATIVFCCFLWGLNQVAAKAAMPEIAALWQAAARSLGGAILVWLWAASRGTRLFEPDRTLPGGLLAGVLFAAEFFCIFVGLQFTTASRMVVWIYIAPFVVALGMPLISRAERLTVLQSSASCSPCRRRLGVRRRLLAAARRRTAVARRCPRHARRRALGRDDARGARDEARPGVGREDAAYQLAVSALMLLVAAPALGRAAAGPTLDAGLGGALLPGGDRHLRELPALVLADPALSCDPALLVHHADAGVRPAARRAAPERAGDAPPRDRAGDRRAGIYLVNRKAA
jgi:hypothetical protein